MDQRTIEATPADELESGQDYASLAVTLNVQACVSASVPVTGSAVAQLGKRPRKTAPESSERPPSGAEALRISRRACAAQRCPRNDPFRASAIWGSYQSGTTGPKLRPFLGQCDQPAFASTRCTVERGAFMVAAISLKEAPSSCSCNTLATCSSSRLRGRPPIP